MPLIFVTGMPATGKSTVQQELTNRGYEAYDSDKNGLSSWRDRQTNIPVVYPEKREDRTHEWYRHNDWRISRKRIESLAASAKQKLVFLCGSPGNDSEVWDLFDQVICLTIDDETLKRRIAARTDNDYGKAPDELEGILEWNKTHESRYRKRGAIIIDAGQPLDKVVNAILDIAKGSNDVHK